MKKKRKEGYRLNNQNFRIKNGVLLKYSGVDAEVIIPDGVTEIGSNVFRDDETVYSVVLPEGVVKIGDSAFEGCKKLKTVTFPSSLKTIGRHAFADCVSLSKAVFSGGLEEVRQSAFDGCRKLKTVVLPDTLKRVCGGAFRDCKTLREIDLPNNADIDGDEVFLGCTSLSRISLPKCITVIGKSWFQDCAKLENLTIPEAVSSICKGAFFGCSSLKALTIPAAVTTIGELAFWKCERLTSITVVGEITDIGEDAFADCFSLTAENVSQEFEERLWKSYTHTALYRQCETKLKNGYTLLQHEKAFIKQHIDDFALQAIKQQGVALLTATLIASSASLAQAENYRQSLKSTDELYGVLTNYIDMHFTAEQQAEYQAQRAKGIKQTADEWRSVYTFTRDGVIEKYIGCDSVAYVPSAIGETAVTCIGAGAFQQTAVQSVVIEDGVAQIGMRAFYQCNALKTVTVPASVTKIGAAAFAVADPRQLVMIGAADSAAARYAEKFHIAFQAE